MAYCFLSPASSAAGAVIKAIYGNSDGKESLCPLCHIHLGCAMNVVYIQSWQNCGIYHIFSRKQSREIY